MNRIVLLALSVAILDGCGRQSRPVSPLQQFGRLAPLFTRATVDSSRLSLDVRGLARNVAAGRVSAARSSAVYLRAGAHEMEDAAGRAAAPLRRLHAIARNVKVRTYMSVLLQALQDQWWEASTLNRLSRIVWHDPLLLVAAHAQALSRLQTNAQWYAWRSVQATKRAEVYKANHRGVFRYIPVTGR
jgi:hypothetical protein